MYRVLQVARSGWYAWLKRRHQPGPRQQFRLICDTAVSQAFAEAIMVRLVSPKNCLNTISKPSPSGTAGESQPEVQPGQLP